MLTFTSNGTMGLRIQGGDRAVTVFDAKIATSGDLILLPVPEEQPSKNTVSWPGEYDYSGITVRGVGQDDGQLVSFLVVADGIHVGCIAAPLLEWTDDQRATLGEIDVLVLPSDDPKKMQNVIDEIDPRILILLPDAKGKLDPDALKTCGATGKEHVREYKVKGLPAEGREVVVLA